MFLHCKRPYQACKTWNTRFSNTTSGTIFTNSNSGRKYIHICITICGKQKTLKAHRLAWLYMTGKYPNHDIDHKDHNGLNNSWNNLRDVDNQENHKNIKMQLNNTSGFTGVSWYKKRCKWRVKLNVNGIEVYGGEFLEIKDAIIKRIQMNIEHGFHKNHGKSI